MMQDQMDDRDLDRALEAEENGSAGHILRAFQSSVRPRPQFVLGWPSRMASAARPRPARNWRAGWWALAASVVLLLVVAGGLWLQPAAPVSAQQVLERAASPRLGPDRAAHYVYTIESTDGQAPSGSAEVWVASDAGSQIVRTATTFTQVERSGVVANIQRIVIEGDRVQAFAYDPRANTLLSRTYTLDQFLSGFPNWFDGPGVARYLSRLDREGGHGVSLLPLQTLNGASVYGVHVDDDGGATYYFDAASYLLRGMEGQGMRLRLARDESLPAVQSPPDAFAFNPPSGAQPVEPAPPANRTGGSNWMPGSSLAAACHLPAGPIYVQDPAATTPFDICREHTPGIDLDSLVEAMLASQKVQPGAAANARIKIKAWLTTPLSQ